MMTTLVFAGNMPLGQGKGAPPVIVGLTFVKKRDGNKDLSGIYCRGPGCRSCLRY